MDKIETAHNYFKPPEPASSSVPVNEDPYYYVATIYEGTVITHSVVGNFISQDTKTLIVS